LNLSGVGELANFNCSNTITCSGLGHTIGILGSSVEEAETQKRS